MRVQRQAEGVGLIDLLELELDPASALFRLAGVGTPDPWQSKVAQSESRHIILNCSRQAGKSTTVSALALGAAKEREGSLILIISPSLRQSGELFRKVQNFRKSLGGVIRTTRDSALSEEYANGSRIVSLPGSEATTRGFSDPDLLIIEEASRVDDELYYAVTPMLAVSGGDLVLLSTPFGKRGFFHEEWSRGMDRQRWQEWLMTPEHEREVLHQEPGEDKWERFAVPASACPRISREFLEEERAQTGEWWFRQEYFCEFLEGMTATFTTEDVDRAFDDELDPWF